MKAGTIDKFNNYCADVMGYEYGGEDENGDAYNPYYNLYQVAAVVQELINRTGEYPECEVFGSGASTWRIWHDYVISTMPNSEEGDKPEGWDEYIKLHKEKLAVMENKEVIKGCVGRERFWEDEDIFDLSDDQLNDAFECGEDILEEAIVSADEMIDMWEWYTVTLKLNQETEAKLKAKLRLELATYEDGMVSMEDYIGQIITICNIHFIANSSVGEQDDE